MRRPVSSSVKATPVPPKPSTGLMSKLSSLCEFLMDEAWDDGSPRKRGTLLLFWEGGSWKVCMHDRDRVLQTFLSAQTLEELLKVCNEALAGDCAGWTEKRLPGAKK